MTPPTNLLTTSAAALPRSGRDRAVRALAILVPLVILAIAAWQYRWMSDDGFINLRVVRNIANGHGPVFNAGERVEASTSPLWVWMLWLADVVIPLRLEWIAVLTGITLTVGGVAAAGMGALRLHDRATSRDWWAPVGALVLVAIAPMWKFSSSGLENGLTFAWIGGCLLALAIWARGDRSAAWWTAMLIGLGPLVRPELGLLSVALVVAVIVGETPRRWLRSIAFAAVAFALPVAYEIFRMGYYASVVPNSALAKEASRPYWSAGWAYLRETVNPYWLWVPLVVIAVGAYLPLLLRGSARPETRRTRLVLVTFLLLGLVTALYLVRVGGDFMQARLLLPSLFMICAPVAVIPIRRETVCALVVVPWALIAMASLRSGADQPRAFGPDTLNAITVSDFGFQAGSPARAWFDGRGVYFLEHKLPGTPSPHDPVVANYGIGVESYALGTETYVLDLLGLGDAFTSHLRLDRRGTVAHEKPLPFPWIPARTLAPGSPVTEGDFVLPKFFLARRIDRPGTDTFDQRVDDARTALRCGELSTFMGHITKPLSASQFLDNLTSAPSNTRFRIAPEPREARRQFC